MDNSPINLLTVEHDPFKISFVESCGLYFEPQLVEIPIPAEESKLFWMTDTGTGRSLPVQPSESKPGFGFLWIEIQPFESLHLELDPFGDSELPVAPVRREGDSIGNGHIRLGLPVTATPTLVPGPIKWIQAMEASARLGMTFFDSGPVVSTSLKWLEHGPLRDAYLYQVEFVGGGFYRATVSLDAGQDFARIDEEFAGAPGDQLVWDFGPERLPEEIFLLDPTPGGIFRRLHFNFDARHARLCAWTQYQQLHDLSDGFGLIWPEAFVGFVTLEGGRWNGNRLNFLEAWTRRYWHDDRRTRRLEPSDSKSDSMPGPEAIPARGTPQAVPHLCVEAWIGGSPQNPGRRSFALVAAPADRLFPGAEDPRRGSLAEHNHFSHLPERERYAREQCRLRRIHVQRGMLSLQALTGKCFVWPEESKAAEPRYGYPDPLLDYQFRHHEPEEAGRIRQLRDYLASRVHGFWEGGGASHSNCVVSRVVAPEMLHYEYLAGVDKLAPEERALLRAHFAFLSHLFHSDNYYPGDATMRGPADALSFEPSIAGMANQNFYTDVICVPATAAQVFSNHPDAKAWRDKFTRDWARQLEYHSYPESGVWEESHTYFEHVLHTVAPTLLRRRDDGDEAPGGGFASARFQKVVGSQLPPTRPRASPERWPPSPRRLRRSRSQSPSALSSGLRSPGARLRAAQSRTRRPIGLDE